MKQAIAGSFHPFGKYLPIDYPCGCKRAQTGIAYYLPCPLTWWPEFPEVVAAATLFKTLYFSNLRPTIKYQDNAL